MRRMTVYISGPITGNGFGNLYTNLKVGMEVWRSLIKKGYAPFCPHTNDLAYICTEPVTWEEALEIDEEFIRRFDAVYRIKGESRGADREERFAKEVAGIPVFQEIEALDGYRKTLNEFRNEFEDPFREN